MKNSTRVKLTAMVSRIAMLNHIDPAVAATSKFTVEPSVQQKLEQRVQESSEFLAKINISPVDEMSGELLGLGIGSTIAGRTNTGAGNRRLGVDPSAMDERQYTCKQTNFDVAITYGKVDLWAKFLNFETLWRDNVVKRIALDRILIGFNGTSAAAATNRVTNPLLQDVNIGWLQKMRTENTARVMDEGTDVAGKVTYGSHADADYVTLDALVWDAKETLPGCDAQGIRRVYLDSAGHITAEQKQLLRAALLEGMPVRRAALRLAIGSSAAYQLRDELAAQLADQGKALARPVLPGKVAAGTFAEADWPPRGPRQICAFRQMLRAMPFQQAKDEWRRARMQERHRDQAEQRLREYTFEQQLARVAAGEIGLTNAFGRTHLEPRIGA